MACYSDKDSFKGKMISQKTAKIIYKASDHYEIPAGTRFKLKGETPVIYVYLSCYCVVPSERKLKDDIIETLKQELQSHTVLFEVDIISHPTNVKQPTTKLIDVGVSIIGVANITHQKIRQIIDDYLDKQGYIICETKPVKQEKCLVGKIIVERSNLTDCGNGYTISQGTLLELHLNDEPSSESKVFTFTAKSSSKLIKQANGLYSLCKDLYVTRSTKSIAIRLSCHFVPSDNKLKPSKLNKQIRQLVQPCAKDFNSHVFVFISNDTPCYFPMEEHYAAIDDESDVATTIDFKLVGARVMVIGITGITQQSMIEQLQHCLGFEYIFV